MVLVTLCHTQVLSLKTNEEHEVAGGSANSDHTTSVENNCAITTHLAASPETSSPVMTLLGRSECQTIGASDLIAVTANTAISSTQVSYETYFVLWINTVLRAIGQDFVGDGRESCAENEFVKYCAKKDVVAKARRLSSKLALDASGDKNCFQITGFIEKSAKANPDPKWDGKMDDLGVVFKATFNGRSYTGVYPVNLKTTTGERGLERFSKHTALFKNIAGSNFGHLTRGVDRVNKETSVDGFLDELKGGASLHLG